MNIRRQLQQHILRSLSSLAGTESLTSEQLDSLAAMVVRSQDERFGDYQANCAMSLAKQLGRSPREVATQLVESLDLGTMTAPPEVAGPGFINLRLSNEWLAEQLSAICGDERLGVVPTSEPRCYVVDYSAPNVAKPMHVGHIRSTVIGDSLYRVLKFLGHRAIGDNHLGDWGTQFGMILYGYHHFRDEAAYRAAPVEELSRLYRLVNQLVDYHQGRQRLAHLLQEIAQQQDELQRETTRALEGDEKAQKKQEKTLRRLRTALGESQTTLEALIARQEAVESDAKLSSLAAQHPEIAQAVLVETAKLHAGDAENLRLWREFMPPCLEAIETIYRRLGVTFDHTLGESFYHDRLAGVVAELSERGLARESDGALCVFLHDAPAPMIVRKKDGAFLYATTDLATIQYRKQTWHCDAIVYVVDHRQSLHFEQLFAVARLWGFDDLELQHVSFGTVLGSDGRPFKTRSGDTVGLSGLLDEAAARALAVVSANDEAKPDGPELSQERRRQIAETVGIAALKYADLSQNRTSDYTFSYEKMLAMNGNTATYMQYAYARVQSIFRRGGVDVAALRSQQPKLLLDTPAERALAIELLGFSEALESVVADYRPNQLTNYLFELANRYSSFFEQCPVLKAPSNELRQSRLLLCDLTARVIKQGLALLGIDVVEQM